MATQIYNGFWWSPEASFTRRCIADAQKDVDGVVTLKLYRGHTYVVARKSTKSLYDAELVSMDVEGDYDPRDAEGRKRYLPLGFQVRFSRVSNTSAASRLY